MRFRSAAVIAVATVTLGTVAIAGPAGAVPPPSGAVIVAAAAGGECPAVDFPTITAAVTAAAAGATIYVCAGTYAEDVVVNKNLTILGAQFGVDPRGGRAGGETIVGSATGSFDVAGGVTATINGFTLSGATNNAAVVTQGTLILTNNIITGNTVGLFPGAGSTTVTLNLFDANNVSGSNSGSSIFAAMGAIGDLTVDANRFSNNVGSGGPDPVADINTAGGATGTVAITNNESVDGTTFVVLNNAPGAEITGNTITQTNPLAATGSAIFLSGASDGGVISDNVIDGGAGNGIRTSSGSPLTGAVTVTNNQVNARSNGIAFQVAIQGTEISGNTVTNSTVNGIHLEVGATGVAVSGNTVNGSAAVDCRDDSAGGGTGGTANEWTGNTGTTTQPEGLCTPPPPTPPTTTPPTTTTPTTPPTTAVGGAGTRPGSTVNELPATGGSSTGALLALIAAVLLVGALMLCRRPRERRA